MEAEYHMRSESGENDFQYQKSLEVNELEEVSKPQKLLNDFQRLGVEEVDSVLEIFRGF